MAQKTVTINGTQYDIMTGLPIKRSIKVTDSAPAPRQSASVHSHAVHNQTQKSATLQRNLVKPAAATPAATRTHLSSTARPATRQSTRHPAVSKFAAHPQMPLKPVAPAEKPTERSDIAASPHPHVKKANTRVEQTKLSIAHSKAPTVHSSARDIKESHIKQALAKAPSHTSAHHQIKQPRRRFSKLMRFGSLGMGALLFGAYMTYLTMPNLSVRYAAAQSGIAASYPTYHPSGYNRGTLAFNDSAVRLNFKSNAGPQDFVLTQKNTTWDSSAVRESYAEKNWGTNIDTLTEQGLTIYRNGSEAAWVNGGVLYTISGDAPLSPSQIRGIATSL